MMIAPSGELQYKSEVSTSTSNLKPGLSVSYRHYIVVLSRFSILTRDIDIANLSVCLSVRPSVTFQHQMKTA